MLRRPLKNRFKLNLNSFVFAFLGLFLVLFVFFWGDWGRPVCSMSSLSVDLAKVQNPVSMRNALREDAITISVTRDGKIFLGTHKVTSAELPALIRESASNGAEKKVYIKADARTKTGNVNEVIDAVRASGVENIAFLTEKETPIATPSRRAVHQKGTPHTVQEKER